MWKQINELSVFCYIKIHLVYSSLWVKFFIHAWFRNIHFGNLEKIGSLNYTHHSNLTSSLYNIKKLLVSFSSNISFIIGKLQALVFQNSKCHLKAEIILLATNNTGCFLEVTGSLFSLLTKFLPNTQVWTQFICQSPFQVKIVFH